MTPAQTLAQAAAAYAACDLPEGSREAMTLELAVMRAIDAVWPDWMADAIDELATELWREHGVDLRDRPGSFTVPIDTSGLNPSATALLDDVFAMINAGHRAYVRGM